MPEKQLSKTELLAKKEELELRKLMAEVNALEDAEVKRAAKVRTAEMRDQNMADANASRERDQTACSHLKGGMGVEGYKGNGNDAGDYSIQKHTYSTGETFVHCLRCFKEWRPGDPDYAKAIRFPTKNTPSQGAIWNIPKKEKVNA